MTPNKYLQDKQEISIEHQSNITRRPIKYNRDTNQISKGHP